MYTNYERINRKQKRIESQKTLLSMLLQNYNEFLTSSSICNESKRILKSDKIEQKLQLNNIYDCKDMLSYFEKNLVSKVRYRRPKNRKLRSETSIISESSCKRRRKNVITFQNYKNLMNDPYYISSSESDDSEDDLYTPGPEVKQETKVVFNQTKKSSKNSEKRRISRELSEVYAKLNMAIQCSTVIETMSNRSCKSKLKKLEINYVWIMELKTIDITKGYSAEYEENCLIILRNFDRKLLQLSLDNFSNFDLNTSFDCSRCSVQITRRCKDGQLYITQSLQHSVHFTLSLYSTKTMIDVLNKNKIMTRTMMDKQIVTTDSNFLAFYQFDNKKGYFYQEKIRSYLTSIGNQGLWRHFRSNFDSTSQQRAKYVLNLGVTGLKCDCYKYISVTGKIAPDLISKQTKAYTLDDNMITTIGKLLMYIGGDVLSSLHDNVKRAFEVEDKYEQEYLDKFSQCLNIDKQCYNYCLKFPAVSLLLNKNLNPHCDKLNPKSHERDYAIVITVKIDLQDIDEQHRGYLSQMYSKSVPLCIVLYNRQCLLNYAKHWKCVNEFVKSNPTEEKGQQNIVNLLHSVQTDADYLSSFFQKKCHKNIEHMFKVDKLCKGFTHKMYTTNEAIDKIGWWSSLLHMYLLYCWNFELKTDDIMCLILFFSHQCTTTTTIVGALQYLLLEKTTTTMKTSITLYTRLVNVCNKLNNTPKRTSDTGSGRHPRFQTTDNKIYSDEEVLIMIDVMNTIFAHYTKIMNELNLSRSDRTDYLKKFFLYSTLLQEFDNPSKTKLDIQYKIEPFLFKGLSTIRINHLIGFASLIGILPIDYYVCTPIHSHGGVGNFIQDVIPKGSSQQNKDLLQWNATMINNLQNIFSCKFTPNMFENLLCIISRKRSRFDIYYLLPTLNKDTGNIIVGEKIQLFFRINGHDKGMWNVEVFNGKYVSTLLSTEYPILNRVIYVRDSSGKLSKTHNHNVDRDWILSK